MNNPTDRNNKQQGPGWQATKDGDAAIDYGQRNSDSVPLTQRDETGRSGPLVHAPVPSSTSPRMGPNLSPPTAALPPIAELKTGPSEANWQQAKTSDPKRAMSARRKRAPKGATRKAAKSMIADGASFALGKRPGPIVPQNTIAGNALVLVIAIMSFLAALTVAAVTIISDATRDWQTDIGRGATIQIRQIDGIDIEGELAKAVSIARRTPGIASATALSVNQSNALLEPWLGMDLAFDDLPVPRLIEMTVENPEEVDFAALSIALQNEVKGAIVDNHRFWIGRLKSMAESAILIGFTILALVIVATILTVIFATRSAMAGNKETIEVLHFVGASHRFIASEFQYKFFTLGLKGSVSGGFIAIVVFLLLQFLIRQHEGSATLDQMQALLGVIELSYSAYIGTLILVVLIAIFTAITTRLTVMNTLRKLI